METDQLLSHASGPGGTGAPVAASLPSTPPLHSITSASPTAGRRRPPQQAAQVTQEFWPVATKRLSKRLVALLLLLFVVAALVAVLLPVVALSPSSEAPSDFAAAVHAERVAQHLAALQRAGSRRIGGAGYEAAAQYIEATLRSAKGSGRTLSMARSLASFFPPHHSTPPTPHSNFSCPTWQLLGWPSMSLALTPINALIRPSYGIDFNILPYSASGNVTNAEMYILSQFCSPSSFDSRLRGKVVVVPHDPDNCTLYNITLLAEDAGAAGIVVYSTDIHGYTLPTNRVRTVDWQPGDRFVQLPVVAVSSVLGQVLLGSNSSVLRVSFSFKTEVTVEDTFTLIVESIHGDPGNIVALGAHLDSTASSPGMNDNGSGAAALLAIAEALINSGLSPARRARFFWWGGETEGGIGSRTYVRALQQFDPEQLLHIQAYINLDTLGSPNHIFSVSNGTTAPSLVQNASVVLQQQLQAYFDAQSLPHVVHSLELNADYDYVPFLLAGVPSASLTAGGNHLKTVDERQMFSGSAYVPCDSCHKMPCDTLTNVDDRVMSVLSSAAAYGFWSLVASE